MRIIGGKHRGRVLKEFEGTEVRPTSDRARESLFNILQYRVAGSTFCDLFAGTGGVGIEALSRSAKAVYFSDVRKESVLLCKSNLALVKEQAEVNAGDYHDVLKRYAERGLRFDILFMDPPYALDATDALQLIADLHLLSENGIVVYEHGGREPGNALEHYDRRKYGIAYFDFYRNKEERYGE